MERSVLIAALRRGGLAAADCADALEAGAECEVFEGTTSGSELAKIYRRRAEHVRSIGLDHGGFDEAIASLDGQGPGGVRLGYVTDRQANRHYQLFLSPGADEVVGCLWVLQESSAL